VSQYPRSDVERVVEAAARKGVALDISVLNGPVYTPEEAAMAVGADLGQIVASIVYVAMRPEGRLSPIVCLVSGQNRVDAGLLAAVIGESSVRRASAVEVRELTGFSFASVPPIGHGRDVRVVMDQDLGAYEWVWAAAGSETALLRVSPRVLRMLSNAFVTPLAETSWAPPVGAPSLDGRLQFETGSRV
jgi:prolyl-tRNA editing enzyme YbaK/EbsC (Cys-tRNA(Pro) deacylase)